MVKKVRAHGKIVSVYSLHVEQNNGILKECNGSIINSLTKQPNFRNRVLGLQKVKTNDNISKIKNWFGFEPAFVEGSDPKSIDAIGKGETVYLKVGEYSFNAIKFALQDHDSRVTKEVDPCKHGFIESVSFQGGKLDSVSIPFSKELNTLIGIRGSGKSTVLETIRYALGLNAEVDGQYKDNLVKNAIGSGGSISLNIVEKDGKRSVIKRLLGEKSQVHVNGKSTEISPTALINNPLYFGQKDLSFTKDGYAFDLLKKLIGNKVGNQVKLLEGKAEELEKLISNILKLTTIQDQINEINSEIESMKYTLSKYHDKGIDEKLEKQIAYNNDRVILEKFINKIDIYCEKLRNDCKLLSEKTFSEIDEKSKYNQAMFFEIDSVLKHVLSSVAKISELINTISLDNDKLKKLKLNFDEQLKNLQEEFANIKRNILDDTDDTLDLENFIRTKKTIKTKEQQLDELSEINSSRNQLILKIQKAIKERDDILRSIFKEYKAKIDEINKSQDDIKIEITFQGDKEQFKQNIKVNFKGTGLTDIKDDKISKQFPDFLGIIIDCIIDDNKNLRNILTESELIKVSENIKRESSSYIKLYTPDLVKIYYHGKPLEQHSIGQRASALILFILTQEDNNLIIIDQPEDDLDNQVIYNEVINTIKKRKKSIQFIFATHNPNIPVLGDAENILVTEYNERRINVEAGNIDCRKTQNKIIDIMEGGKEAFKKRKLIYSNWNIAD